MDGGAGARLPARAGGGAAPLACCSLPDRARPTFVNKEVVMLWTITVILLVLWVLGLVSGSAIGAWVHILLILAVVSLIFAVMRRGAAGVP
jgi:fatty acid desaturase